MSGYPLAVWSPGFGASAVETIFTTSINPIWDFDGVATSITARVWGSLNGFSGTECTLRVYSQNSLSGLGTLLGTFPVLVAGGIFSLEMTFAPPAGARVFYLTVETDSGGTPSVDELMFILEVS